MLFFDDVDYLNVYGDYFKGKEEVVLSLNEFVCCMLMCM